MSFVGHVPSWGLTPALPVLPLEGGSLPAYDAARFPGGIVVDVVDWMDEEREDEGEDEHLERNFLRFRCNIWFRTYTGLEFFSRWVEDMDDRWVCVEFRPTR